jgi:RNA polymerase sigma-54 factor
MKQSLNLKLGHKLKLTPRLQQAINLLQLSSVDLESEIRDALEDNPFLEEREGPAPGMANELRNDADGLPDRPSDTDEFADATANGTDYLDAARDQPPGDTTMPDRESVIHGTTESYPTLRDSYDSSAFLDNLHGNRSLADTLREQLRIAPLSSTQLLIAEVLLENINEHGYLETEVEEVIEFLRPHMVVSEREVEAVISVIQSMDPPGIGARDLRECLLIQLAQLSPETPALRHARTMVEQHFDALGRRDFPMIRRMLAIDEATLTEALGVIRHLDPRPAASLDQSLPAYVVPDVVVSHGRDGWQVRLNEEALSKLTISPSSRTYLSAEGNREDKLYFRQRYQDAKWFLQSLRQRNETILRVASEIVRLQQEFFELGERAMKPLTLRQVAEALELHESTVSRATSHKYLLSPRGTHELKYFFSSQLAGDQGDAFSSTAIQARIRLLIAAEPEHRPISDQKIADHFKSQGITVARRTVAKYREQMHIPPSSQRKGYS